MGEGEGETEGETEGEVEGEGEGVAEEEGGVETSRPIDLYTYLRVEGEADDLRLVTAQSVHKLP